MGPKSEVDPTGGLRKHMDLIIFNLNRQREELLAQITKYTELASSISLSSSIDDEVMILLGDGIFVKYSPEKATEYLHRRIQQTEAVVGEISTRLDEVKVTLNKMNDFDSVVVSNGSDKYNEEGLLFSEIREELDEEGNVINVTINDENFLANLEENDDVVDESGGRGERGERDELEQQSLQRQLQDDKTTPTMHPEQPISKSRNLNLLDELDSSRSDIKIGNNSVANLAVNEANVANEARNESFTGRKSDIVNDIVEKMSNFDVDSVKDDITSVVVVPKAEDANKQTDNGSGGRKEPPSETTLTELTESGEPSDKPSGKPSGMSSETPESISDLFQEMEVIGNTNLTKEDELLEKLDSLDISADDKFRLKALLLEEYRNQQNPDGIESSDSSQIPYPERGRQDVIELEILADDFDSNEDFNHPNFADDEEWDFEFSDDGNDDAEEEDDGDDEDDDAGDDLLYGKSNFISNEISNSRLWEEVLKLRKMKEETSIQDNIKQSDENGHNDEVIVGLNVQKPKKSVRFAEELQIFEIENVSAELKSIRHTNQNVSIFMQNRLFNKPEPPRTIIEKTAEEMRAVDPVVIDNNPGMEETASKSTTSNSTKLSRFRMLQNEKRERSTSKENDMDDKKTLKEVEVENKMVKEEVQSAEENVEGDKLAVTNITEHNLKPHLEIFGDIVEKDIDLEDTTIDNVVNHVIERDNLVFNNIIERDNIVLQNVIERDTSVMNDVIERDIGESNLIPNTATTSSGNDFSSNHTVDTPSRNPKSNTNASSKPSRFKLGRTQDVKVIELPNEKVAEFEPLKDRRQLLAESIAQFEDKDEEKPTDEHEHEHELEKDTDDNGSELDLMARDYINGVYDDDIDLPGPVVNHLNDFEMVNRVIEGHNAMLKQEGLIEEDEEGSDLDEEESELDEDDGDILVDIMENEPDEPAQDIQDRIVGDEVEQEYHRLRRKLMQSREHGYRKSESELEFEPIDEEGNPVKVSRFKAARMAFHT